MKKLLPLILFLILAGIAKAQIITTTAGGGSISGNGTFALSAYIYDPAQLVFDKLGNLYISQPLANRICKINPNGILTIVAGTGSSGYNGDNISAITAQLNVPSGICFDSVGNLFVADRGNNRVRKINISTGIITTVAGNGFGGFGGDNGQAVNAFLNTPTGVCFDHIGNLFISDYANNRVRKINTSGTISTYAGNGSQGFAGDSGTAIQAQLYILEIGTCADDSGNVYVTDAGRVRKINTLGIINTVAGDTLSYSYNGDGIIATTANIQPASVCFNQSHDLFLADRYNNRVRNVDNSGDIHTIAGNGALGHSGDNGLATLAEISEPTGTAFDSCGNLYISEVGSPGYIRKVWIGTTTIPSASIAVSPNNTVCAGTSVTFTATPINAGTTPTYQWLKNGIIVSGATNNTYAYTPTNGDSVQCIVVSSIACAGPTLSNAIFMTVTPSVTSTISISPNPNGTVCTGTAVTYTATITNGGTTPTYQWIKNGTTVGTNSSSYTYIPNNNDSVRCVLTSNAACASPLTVSSNMINMVVNPTVIPTINISPNPNDTVCVGTSVTYTANITNGGTNPIYQWVKNGINVGANTNTYSYTPNNIDSVRCVLTSNATCASPATVSSNTINMVVNPTVTPSISISPNPNDTICAGTSVTYTASITNGGTIPLYQWIKDGANVGTSSTSYTYTPNNLDSVRCVLTSNATCASPATVSSNTINMVVNPTVTPTISISANPSSTVCTGTSVTYTATITNGGATPAYQWVKNGANTGTNASTYTYTPNNLDSVRCTLTSNATCASPALVSSNTIDITVNPIIHPTISLSGTTLAPVGNPVTINATVTNAGSSYVITWMNHGIVFNSTTVPSVTYNKPTGIDTITAKIVSTDIGCYDSTISTQFIVQVEPNAVNNIATSAIQVYPNPTSNVLHIDGVQEQVTYRLLDIVGVTLQEGMLQAGSNSISIQALPSGIYMLEMTGDKAQVTNLRQWVRVVKE